MVLDSNLNISSFGEDEAGELYVADYYGGTIRRLADVAGPSPDLSTSSKLASVVSADIGAIVTYTIQLRNHGGAAANNLMLVDSLPVNMIYIPGSLNATSGTINDTDGAHLKWQVEPAGWCTCVGYLPRSGERDKRMEPDQPGVDYRCRLPTIHPLTCPACATRFFAHDCG